MSPNATCPTMLRAHRAASVATLAATLAAVALLATVAATPAAADDRPVDPRTVLRSLSRSYYNLDRAGLARATAYVQSQDILDSLGPAAEAVLREPKYECTFVPGQPAQVKAVNLPPGMPSGSRAAVGLYRLAAEAVVKAVFTGLQAIPDLLDPATVEQGYDLRLADLPAKGGRKPGRQVTMAARDPTGLRDGPATDEIVLTLDADGRLTHIRHRTDKGVEEIGVGVELWGDTWAVGELDVAKYDTAGTLLERTVVSLDYSTLKGLHLPTRVTFKAVDRGGRVLHREDHSPNPVTLRFSQYRIERQP